MGSRSRRQTLPSWWHGDQIDRFNRLVEAHDCLVDSDCRAEYDAALAEPAVGARQQPPLHSEGAGFADDAARTPRAILLGFVAQLQGLGSGDLQAWLGLLSPRGLLKVVVFMLVVALSAELFRPLLVMGNHFVTFCRPPLTEISSPQSCWVAQALPFRLLGSLVDTLSGAGARYHTVQ